MRPAFVTGKPNAFIVFGPDYLTDGTFLIQDIDDGTFWLYFGRPGNWYGGSRTTIPTR